MLFFANLIFGKLKNDLHSLPFGDQCALPVGELAIFGLVDLKEFRNAADIRHAVAVVVEGTKQAHCAIAQCSMREAGQGFPDDFLHPIMHPRLLSCSVPVQRQG